MKKFLTAIIVLTVLMGMTACGNSDFKSQEDMFAYLNGMWVVDDLDQNEYYIFQNGQVYQIEDWSLKNTMETYMDNILKNSGLDSLYCLDYKTVLAKLTTEDILGNPFSDIEINHKKGTIVLNKDKSNEKHIIIDEGSVHIKNAEEKDTILLKKISDEVDFTDVHFEDLFNAAKNNYTVSTAQFWTDAKEYGNMIKNYNPEVDGWELTTQNETTTIYESSKWVPNISGALIITDTSVTFTKKVSLLNSWTSNIDWNPSFTVHYTPNEGKIIIMDQDNLSLDLPLLIQYAANAVRNFPGAYEDYMELYNILAAEKGTTSNGVFTVEKTINGLTYKIQMGTDGYWAMVTVTANETLKLSTIMSCIESTATETQPDETNSTEPATSTEANGNTPTTPATNSPVNSNSSVQTPVECSHIFTAATCTEPETCTLCGVTGKAALGHSMSFTKCVMCDHIDYSCIAGTYSNVDGYGIPVGTTTTVDLVNLDSVNMSVSNSGVLSFSYNGKDYSFTIKQNNEGDQYTAHFDCYLNGVLVEETDFRAGSAIYDYRIYLDDFIIDDCHIYLYATPSAT